MRPGRNHACAAGPKSLLKTVSPAEDIPAESCGPHVCGEPVTNEAADADHLAIGPNETVTGAFAFQNRIEAFPECRRRMMTRNVSRVPDAGSPFGAAFSKAREWEEKAGRERYS